MNGTFIKKNVTKGDLIRITTKEAIGVIGRVEFVDVDCDGILLKEIESAIMDQVEHAMTYEKVLFPMTDIKYLFIFNLTTKPNKDNGSNDG